MQRSGRAKDYRSRGQIGPWVRKIEHRLRAFPVHICGSWRRGSDRIGDLDVLIVTKDGNLPPELDLLVADFLRMETGGDRHASGSIFLDDGLQPLHVDFYATGQDSLGGFLWFLTGPQGLNIAMRADARSKGCTLSQYGLKHYASDITLAKSEKEIAMALGAEWVALLDPLKRESWGNVRRGEEMQTREVTGSKGDKYVLTIQGEGPKLRVSCTCMGFKFRRSCKHEKAIRDELTADLSTGVVPGR